MEQIPAIGKLVEPSKAAEVSSSLRGTPEQKANEVKTLTVTLTSLVDIKVVLAGAWDGRLLKGVIRHIERHYRGLKLNAMRIGK